MCTLTQGNNPKTCKIAAGASEFLIAEFDAIEAVTIAAGAVTAIDVATGKQFWKYKQKAEVGNWKQPGAGDPKTGSASYTPEVNLQTQGIDTASQEENDLLLKTTVVVIAKNNDGQYWLIGHEFGLDAPNVDTDSGTAMNDFIGDTIKFTGKATMKAKKVPSGLIAALLAPAT